AGGTAPGRLAGGVARGAGRGRAGARRWTELDMTGLLAPPPSDAAEASSEQEALDAYSAIVVSVAEHIVPSVASLRVAARGREGAGSAVVLSADGYLLTSAHVVAGAE